MWTITARDLRYRWRQFLIAVLGTGLTFALALDLTGMSQGFRTEARRAVSSIGADAWLVPAGVSGPFTSFSVMPAATAEKVAAMSGVRRADALVIFPTTVGKAPSPRGVGMIGYVPGGIGSPDVSSGRPAERSGEIVTDSALHARLGDHLTVGGEPFVVVGVVHDRTYFAGVPLVFATLGDTQRIAFGAQPLSSVVVTEGVPAEGLADLTLLSNQEVRRDLLRPLANPTQTIDNTRLFMWAVAALIVGAVTYLSVLERLRDLAVLKAVGATSRSIVMTVCTEAVAVSLLAAALAAVLANVLRPAFQVPLDITAGAYVALPLVAIVVGMLASLVAIRRAVRVDPALAFAS